MDPKLWLLVEYVEDKSAFSNYGVINTNNIIQHDTDLNNGNIIFVRDKNNGARKAQVLRISESKRYVKDLKIMLERQDNQVKNVVTLCMNTIKEMKTGQLLLDPQEGRSLNALNRTCKLPEEVETSSSDSDSDEEIHHNLNLTKSMTKHHYQSKRPDSMPSGQISRLLNDKTIFHSRKPLKSSTPLPEKPFNDAIKLTFDQGTQTDPEQHPSEKIEELQVVLERLYGQFLALIAEVELKENQSAIEAAENNFSEPNVMQDFVNTDTQYLTNADIELDQNQAKVLQVRRASAQTTNAGLSMVDYNTDMVSIGSGNVTVPARLWATMDWTSHTSATRQLLQAVFPRRVLATHSLTGKQSPAFVDRPPKQRLDPKLVDDIVTTVSERCNVPKRIVRSSITTKCTDEAKLYKNRLQQRKRDQRNPENVSPQASSNESSNARD
ncbi:unnamed protein product [Danaus chrysippus]|uniref:(African queen) hypothetical protein n=1 Tax=Danaus chrysippus TaxID=151541 RepID=A0A8J2W2H3_9NEOP|nr:unnamed protein product [Danaus chrysippus]